ncbi:MAG: hypothetical protein EZS28_031669 [Streblomastix strix]|uniref:Uncharacterized protein n=1 Tax=Streblomastix strix TaxID=222440 RepID=A0A5J4USS2_9EUKA|nr:MAG: hypothetical protein EZS28_031669 [Streblomastix strix]
MENRKIKLQNLKQQLERERLENLQKILFFSNRLSLPSIPGSEDEMKKKADEMKLQNVYDIQYLLNIQYNEK